MRYFKLLILALAISPIANLKAQTGPGGIGNSATNRIWLDANTLALANGTACGSWTDRSGNAWTATSATTSRPIFRTNQLNGFPSLDFDGSNDYLAMSNVTGIDGQPITWFLVGNFDVLNNSQMMLHYSHVGGAQNKNLRYTLYHSNSNKIFSSQVNMTGGGPVGLHTFSTASQILTSVIGASTLTSFTNGGQTGTFTQTMYNPISANSLVSLGRRAQFNDYYLNGKIAECIVFNYQLGVAERTIVENYLGSKYNRVLSNDRYALEGTGHYFDLAGIGQEPGNTVSSSRGPSIVTMNNASALGDGDYVMWAHNNASVASTVAGCPSFFTYFGASRMTRIWGVQTTGTPGTVSVSFDMTGINFGASTSDYVLLLDDDGDFSNGGTQVVGADFTFNGGTNTATWDNVDFTGFNYFTIANMDGIISVNDGDWTDPNTWNCECTPSNVDVVANVNNHIVNVDDASCTALDFINDLGATLTFSASSDLTLEGDFRNEGTLTGLNGIVTFAGSSLQTVNGTGTFTWDNLTLNNSAGMILTSGTHTLRSNLTITDGEFDINNQSFTLLSTATRTARIAPVGATGSIAGRLTVQRFISNRPDGTSTMASPVSDATFDEWTDDLELLFVPYVEGSSIPSIFTYDESEFDYVPIENSGDNIKVAIGYEVYLDNDGSTGTPFGATTLTTFGSPNFGDIDASQDMYMDNDGWNLIGNPYASSISFVSFQTASGGSFNTTWMFYNEVINDYSAVTGGTIAPHQGFWVEVLSMPVTATFTESMKSAQMNTTFRNYEEALFGIRLSSDGINKFTSNTHFRFNPSATLAYEAGQDLSFMKVQNPDAPSLFTVSAEGKKLRINELSDDEELIIPLKFDVNVSGYYFLSANELDQVFEMGYNCAVIEDTRTNQVFDLSAGNYRFYADKDEANDRFVLKLSKTANNCRMSESALVDLEPAGVSILKNENGLYVNFELEEMENASITVINTLGQNIINPINQNVKEQNVKIYLPADYMGVYLINVRVGDKIITRKFFN